MFWLTSICSILLAGFVLRTLHSLDFAKPTFYTLLTITLLLFNVAIAVILANFWIDAFPWSQPIMLLGLTGITLVLAIAVRLVRPTELRNLANHKAMLKMYSLILVSSGFVGGLIFGAPAFTRDYIIKSDRWADIATAITITEITSLYTLALALIISIGSSAGKPKASPNVVE